MSLLVNKTNLFQQRYPVNSEVFCNFDDNKIEKISVPIQQNDSFEKANNSSIDEMGMATIASCVLGGAIGYWVTSGQKFFIKLVALSIGALIGIGTAAYYYAKKLVNENKID